MQLLEPLEVGAAELVPLGEQRQRVGALGGVVVVARSSAIALAEDLLRRLVGHRIVRVHRGARRRAARSITVSAGASRMSSVPGLNASPHTAIVLPRDGAAEVARRSCRRARAFWRSLTRWTASRISSGAAALARGGHRRLDVLGEAGAAVADAGEEELRPDARVHAHAAAHHLHVGADALAQVGHVVHEARCASPDRRWRRTWSARPSARP